MPARHDQSEKRYKNEIEMLRQRCRELEASFIVAQLELASIKTAHEHCESWCSKLATAAQGAIGDMHTIDALRAKLVTAEKRYSDEWVLINNEHRERRARIASLEEMLDLPKPIQHFRRYQMAQCKECEYFGEEIECGICGCKPVHRCSCKELMDRDVECHVHPELQACIYFKDK